MTAVLTLYLLPDILTGCQGILNLAPSKGSNADIAEGLDASLSKTIAAQHFKFKLLTGLRLSCSFKSLSSGQHAYSNHRDEVAAITVKLFDQTLLAGVEMLGNKETVFGVRDGAQLMNSTHPCLVALAAALHWPQHKQAIAYRMGQHLFAVQPVICA
jgi:hypothetical protein